MSENKQFVAYYRVSTKKQGKSGLGLDSQKEIVENYLQSIDGLSSKTLLRSKVVNEVTGLN